MSERTGFMTRKEMLDRLDAGEHPARLSVEKWQRIRDMGRKLTADEVGNYCYGSTCGMCEYACMSAPGEFDCSVCLNMRFRCCMTLRSVPKGQPTGYSLWGGVCHELEAIGPGWYTDRLIKELEKLAAKFEPADLCPVCGEHITITGMTTDDQLVGSCGDAFTKLKWWESPWPKWPGKHRENQATASDGHMENTP